MKVRVISTDYPNYYHVQVKRWFWPVWITKSLYLSKDKALYYANQLVNPEVIFES